MKAYDRFLQSDYRVYADGALVPLSQEEAWIRLHSFEGSRFLNPAIFIRGLPGVDKTTFAKHAFPRWPRFKTDDFATDDHGRRVSFRERHEFCREAMYAYFEKKCFGPVVVDDTFSRWSIIKFYMQVTDPVVEVPLIVHLHHGLWTPDILYKRCRHGVPLATIEDMLDRWDPWPGELLVTHGDLPDSLLQTFMARWKPWPGLPDLGLA